MKLLSENKWFSAYLHTLVELSWTTCSINDYIKVESWLFIDQGDLHQYNSVIVYSSNCKFMYGYFKWWTNHLNQLYVLSIIVSNQHMVLCLFIRCESHKLLSINSCNVDLIRINLTYNTVDCFVLEVGRSNQTFYCSSVD